MIAGVDPVIEIVAITVSAIIPLYAMVAKLHYRLGKLQEEVTFLKQIILKFIRLNGDRK